MRKKKITVDLKQLEPIDVLTADEQEFHDIMMSQEAVFHHDVKTINAYAEVFKNNAKQRKVINLRIPKQDYFAIKAKAVQLGLPYQALINSIIHRYVNDELGHIDS